jgi:energy-coupling factor transporter ATP-binding protein EcfA2
MPAKPCSHLLDEPETGLSPQRQMALLCLLDNIHCDGRSQALVATHSPILMSHPGAGIFWLGEDGIERRLLEEVEHWRDMRRFMGSIANGHISTIQSEVTGLTRNLFLLIDAQGKRPGQVRPAHAIGILCAFSNFLIDHLATPVPVARSAALATASLQISEPAML